MSKILIVDDTNAILDFISLYLKLRGYEVQTASTKSELHNKVPLFSPDLILLDIRLGGENGKELCKEIKESNPSRNIPIILLSASPNMLKDYNECNADDVLEKPFELEVLDHKIKMLLKSELPL